MSELFKHIFYPNKKDYKILEFGSGDSTIKIYNYFKQKVANVVFYSYESDQSFMFDHKDINLVFYDKDNIEDVLLPTHNFDLILIDDPNGDKRSLWYSKIRGNVKEGTIILIELNNEVTNKIPTTDTTVLANVSYDHCQCFL